MLQKNVGKIILSVAVFFLSTVLTVNAQPSKIRGAGVTPKPVPAPTAAGQTPLPPASVPATKKKSVVVLDFNDVSLTPDSVKRPIGKQLAVLLTTEFARRGNYSVISQRDKEIAEERIKSRSEGKDSNYASQVGKQLSANLVVFGDLIEYTIVTETSNKYIKKDVKNSAKVGFTLTLVDVSTNEVKDGVTIEYVATSKDTDYGFYNTNKPLTDDQRITMLTEASKAGVVKAIDKLNELLETRSAVAGIPAPAETGIGARSPGQSVTKPAESSKTTAWTEAVSESDAGDKSGKHKKGKGGWFGSGIFGGGKDKNKPDISKDNPAVFGSHTSEELPPAGSASNIPRIAAIEGQEIFVRNLPENTKAGARLTVFRLGKTIKDKITGEVLKQEQTVIGELEVVSKADKSFICVIITGSGITEDSLIKFVR